MANDIIPFSQDLAQQLVESLDNFPVDFDLAWKWLGYANKASAIRKLKSFTSGRDFNKVVEKTTGRDLQRFWLAVDCFKMLGMLAQTEQGNQVREYFLECERAAKDVNPAKDQRLVLAEQFLMLTQNQIAIEAKQAELELENQRLRLEQDQIKAEQALLQGTVLEHDAEIGRIFQPDGMLITLAGCLNLLGKSATAAQLSSVGRKAAKIYREKYGKEPELIGDARYGKVFAYPRAIAEQVLSEYGYI